MKCIKGATLEDDLAGASGFILGAVDSLENDRITYQFKISGAYGFAFLFGFQGIGCHYRCDVVPQSRIIALYQVSDGIPVYLHHLCVDLAAGSVIEIHWQAGSVRVSLNGFFILNVITNGPKSGHHGFTSLGQPYQIPEVKVSRSEAVKFGWVCLGDGFSNSRWRNRHFLSWPEILFGESDTCLNACVGAGNTRRVLNVIELLGESLKGANIIVAAGSDDLIEGGTFDDFAASMKDILARLRQAHTGTIHLCTLPPRASDPVNTERWSEGIHKLAAGAGLPVLDFHGWLRPQASTCMVYGEYPGAAGQKLLAERVAGSLALSIRGTPPATYEPTRPGGRRLSSLAAKADRMLKRWTLDYPGLLR